MRLPNTRRAVKAELLRWIPQTEQVWAQMNEEMADGEASAVDCYLSRNTDGDGEEAWPDLMSTAGALVAGWALEVEDEKHEATPPRMSQSGGGNVLDADAGGLLFEMLTAEERLRLQVFMGYSAEHASGWVPVKRFRRYHLPDGLVSLEDFDAWFTREETTERAVEEAYRVAEEIAENYLISQRQALRFLLTGAFPFSPSLTVSRAFVEWNSPGKRTRRFPHLITLRLPITASADSVARIWRSLQADEFGRQHHPLHSLSLRLLLFVLEARWRMGMTEAGSKQERRELCCEWNALQSDPKHRFQPKRFLEAWKRAEQALLREIKKGDSS